MRDIAEVENKIKSGSLSLTALTQAQSFFRKETSNHQALNLVQKREVLNILENKTTRECEKELIRLRPEALPKQEEKTRRLTDELTEVKVILKNETLEKLKKLKNLLSNSNPRLSLQDLIEMLAEEALKKFDRAANKPLAKEENRRPKQVAKIPATMSLATLSPSAPKFSAPMWIRDGGRCSFVDPLTGKKCGSQFKMHFDHIIPWATNPQSFHLRARGQARYSRKVSGYLKCILLPFTSSATPRRRAGPVA